MRIFQRTSQWSVLRTEANKAPGLNRQTFFSSATDNWETPQELFDEFDREFHFDLDVCATPENAKCHAFYTPHMDGLKQRWYGNVWCNPPYGRAIKRWVEKASVEICSNCDLIAMLIPARTETLWFHDYIYNKPGVEVRFIKGRIKFSGSPHNAPFPSMLVIFRKSNEKEE